MRYFAAAAEAVGLHEERLLLAAGANAQNLAAAIAAAHPGARRVLEISALLVDGVTCDDRSAPLTFGDAVRVDVLPPFAGG
ncbi:MoaD/ThiS family protein [Georgenia thermotolerans]|uniref:MoaD/ThiS family protein n=1 Tax=Georgenia thermotolerans TaxID=527326 RepID=UPI001D01A401|nr:MoaD/ThiS family protein [Georgenia thermotolerans]